MQFLLQVQELRHCILFLPQVQELHVEPTPLHLHVAVTVLQVTAVADGLGHQFIIVKDFSSAFMFQPHSNFDGGGLSDKVLPQIQPAWNALKCIPGTSQYVLLQCSFAWG